MARPGALEGPAAHQADTIPRLVTGLVTEFLRILFGVAHRPRRLPSTPAIRNAPDGEAQASADPRAPRSP